MTHWSKSIPQPACDLALEWSRTQPSLETAWRECQRGDWMLWLLGRCGADRKRLVKAAALCVEPAAALCDEYTEAVCLSVVQTCVAWSEGDASEEERLRATGWADAASWTARAAVAATRAAGAEWAARAARAAEAAGAAATWEEAWAAWAAAADAAWAADAAADAADAAARAADAAAAAAGWAAAEAAKAASQGHSADIVRGVFPSPPKLQGKGQ